MPFVMSELAPTLNPMLLTNPHMFIPPSEAASFCSFPNVEALIKCLFLAKSYKLSVSAGSVNRGLNMLFSHQFSAFCIQKIKALNSASLESGMKK